MLSAVNRRGRDSGAPRILCDAGLAAAVSQLGEPGFHATLLAAIAGRANARHLTHYRYDRFGRIEYAAAVSRHDDTALERALHAYRAGLYERDPSYALIRSMLRTVSEPAGHAQLLGMPVGGRIDAEYRNLMFRSTGVADKLSLVHRCGTGVTYLNLYFADHDAACACREPLEGDLLTLLGLAEKHAELLGRAPGSPADGDLSSRERDVARLLRMGLSAKEIGRELRISPTTVITYKKRIFAKRNVPGLKMFLCGHADPVLPRVTAPRTGAGRRARAAVEDLANP